MKTSVFFILLFSLFSCTFCLAQRGITINNKVNHSELYDSFRNSKRSIDNESINLKIDGIEIKNLKRKKYIKPIEESNIFYFEKSDGIKRTTVFVSAEKTLIYEYQDSFASKIEISKDGYKKKKKSRPEVRSSSTDIVQVGYSYDQSVEMSHPDDFEMKLGNVISDVNIM